MAPGTRRPCVSAVEKIVPGTVLAPAEAHRPTPPIVAKAERVIRPESIAFGVFGLIAALAALLIGGQVVARLVRRNADDGAVLRALGAGPVMTTADGLVGILGALVALGALLAVAVAVGSPLWRRSAPCGPSIRTPASPSTGRSSAPVSRSWSWCWAPRRS